MHRDVECGTFQRDNVASKIFGEGFYEECQRSIHREWRKVDREKRAGRVYDPFASMMGSMPTGVGSG